MTIYNTADLMALASISTGASPYGVAVTPDGQEVFVANMDGGTVHSYRASDYAYTEQYNVGEIEPLNLAMYPGGRHVYVTGFGTSIYILDRQEGRVAAKIDGVGEYAPGCNVAFSADGSRVYVSSGGGKVTVLGF